MAEYKRHVRWFTTRPAVANAAAATVAAPEPQTFRELQAELKARGLPADGTKAQLIARLSNG